MSTRKPEPPSFTVLETPDLAVAQSIRELTNTKNIELLTLIESRDVNRFAVLKSIARDFNLTWLDDYVTHNLALRASIKGMRSQQIVTIAKAPDMLMPEQQGIMGRIRGAFRR